MNVSDVACIAAGIAIIIVVARDIFATLFVPYGHGRLSRWISEGLWQGFRRDRRFMPLAGPSIVIVIIVTWAAAIMVGWALIYLPLLPQHFQFDDGLGQDQRTGFGTAIYLSMVTLATLGFGDIVPDTSVMRVLTPLQAVIGFAVVTTSLTTVISIYSVLAHQRELAHHICSLRETERRCGTSIEALDPRAASEIYARLTSSVIAVRNDLVQFPVTYYFHSSDWRGDLPALLPYAYELAARGQEARGDPAARFQATMLIDAIESFAEVVANDFEHDGSLTCEEALACYGRDHQVATAIPASTASAHSSQPNQ